MSDKKQLVVIGNGMVGHNFLKTLINKGGLDQYNITVFCEEERPAYDRVHLSEYFSGKTAAELSMVEAGFFESNGIQLHLADRAAKIDTTNKTIISEAGVSINYDKCVIASGSYPFVPPVPGHDQDGCLVYRTIEDLEAIEATAKTSKVGVVVGGGLLGLECANAVKNLGLETHVVEFAPQLMGVQIDEGGGTMLRQKIEGLGVQVHTSKNTKNIAAGTDSRFVMEFADGETLATDMIVFSAGIRPRDDIARESGINVGERGGIEVDNNCKTSADDVYAIGECALWGGRIFGLVAPGYQMATVVADTLLEQDNAFLGADMSTKLKLMGVDVASIGYAHGRTSKSQSYVFTDGPNEIYKRIVVSEDGKKLLGAVLIGEASDYGMMLQMFLNGIDLPEFPDALILPQRDGSAAVGLGADALPDTAQICSCHDVSKGDLCTAVQGGATTLGDLKTSTKAATGCGGCAALVGQVMNAELLKLGVEVNTDLCEHFPYTRQDIYNLVRVGQIKSFSELLEKHGSGKGCEICKPAAASILASCWNEYVLKDEHIGLQDTNDIYLGNMQKDGTYSVVPRVAGGEILPEQLIVLGQVGKEYNLYTKVTGGQRIDLFGAQLADLPAIWSKLIDAGFETGHAYAKSLRTVKSCVGSTWCRYGVDDSVGFAIELENRYKGLRSPHKLKMGVSGCTRECAEAQSKDVGVIATENGWNLYVCGNGGMKPRHADLLASDLDKDTLIKYVDRMLMFYVRTADRLQRTSVWLENLEGGIDYLRQVVCEDSLALGEELESEMAIVIDNYRCEWKEAVNDPKALKRFAHFINSKERDDNIVLVDERHQLRPATEAEREQLIAKAS